MNKISLILLLTLIVVLISAQKTAYNWEEITIKQTIKITKSGLYKVDNFSIEVIWKDSLYKSENDNWFGGIKSAIFFENGKQFQTIKNLKDKIGLGYINISFFDYNMDGHIDFSCSKTVV